MENSAHTHDDSCSVVPGEWQWVFWPAALSLPDHVQQQSLEEVDGLASSPGAACFDALLCATEDGTLWPPADTVASWMGVSAERLQPPIRPDRAVRARLGLATLRAYRGTAAGAD